MSKLGQVGDLCDIGLEGRGWTGVTRPMKRTAGGQDRADAFLETSGFDDPEYRAELAAGNANVVAAVHGSGHWTGGDGSGGDVS